MTDGNSVALAAIGLAVTTVAGLIWVLKYFAKTLAKDLQEHTKAAVQQTSASLQLEKTVKRVGDQAELSARNSEEQLIFMKNLNGKLAKATIQTVAEQRVRHQTVEQIDKK